MDLPSVIYHRCSSLVSLYYIEEMHSLMRWGECLISAYSGVYLLLQMGGGGMGGVCAEQEGVKASALHTFGE